MPLNNRFGTTFNANPALACIIKRRAPPSRKNALTLPGSARSLVTFSVLFFSDVVFSSSLSLILLIILFTVTASLSDGVAGALSRAFWEQDGDRHFLESGEARMIAETLPSKESAFAFFSFSVFSVRVVSNA